VTLIDEVENPVSIAEPEAIVVDGEESKQEQQQSEQQPIIMDECRSENETPAHPLDADFG